MANAQSLSGKDMNGRQITNVGAATADTDIPTWGQVKDLIATFRKADARVASTTQLTLSGLQTVDDVQLLAGDRVLLTGQTDPAANGLYIAADGGWSRASDADSASEFSTGWFVSVEEGTVHGGTVWKLERPTGTVTLGTTALPFVKIGPTLPGGAQFAIATNPATAGGQFWTFTHGLGSYNVIIVVRRTAAPYDDIDAYISRASPDAVSIGTDVPLVTGEYTAMALRVDVDGAAALTEDPAQPLAQAQAPGLWTWTQAWPRRTFETVNVVCVGSSTTHGAGSTAVQHTMPARLGFMLRGVDGSAGLMSGHFGGLHVRADHAGWTSTGTVADLSTDLGLQSKEMSAGSTMTFAYTGDGVEVMHAQGNLVGQLSVTYDNDAGKVTTVTPSTLGTTRSDGLTTSYPTYSFTRGTRTVKVTAIARTILSGVYFTDGDATSGLRVYNAGKGGTTSSVYAPPATNWNFHAARLAELQPRLIVFTIGANDYALNIDPTVYETNVRSAITAMRLACNQPVSVLLVQSFRRLDVESPTYAWSLYGDALRRIAGDTADVDFLDCSPHFPTSRRADWEQLISSDNVHPTNRGHALLASLIADHLMRSLSTRTAPASPLPVTGTDPSSLSGLVSAWRASDLSGGVDGSAIASWPAYAGSDQQALAQGTADRQPVLRKTSATFAGQTCVDFEGSSTGDCLFCTFTTRVNPPATVIIVARLRNNYGSFFSGYTASGGIYLSLSPSGEMWQLQAAGGQSAPNAATITTGRGRWAVYVSRYDGAASAVFQTGFPKQTTGIDTSLAAAGLPGLTLGAASSAVSAFQKMDVAEVLVFSRALSDTECTDSMAWLSYKYGFDGSGRRNV